MKLRLFILTLLIAVIGFSNLAIAQNEFPKPPEFSYNKWSVDLHSGLMLLFGDIKQYPLMPVADYNSEYKFGFGLSVNHQLSTTFNIKANLLFGTLAGTKRQLNRTSRAEITEYSLLSNMSLNNLFFPNKTACRLKVYAIGGVGFFSFRSSLRRLNSNKFITGYGYDATGRSQTSLHSGIVVPLGMGIKYRIDDDVDLGIESTYRLTNTDKLDAADWAGTASDKYVYTSVTVTYKFGNGRYQLEWLSPKQKKDIDKFMVDSIYKHLNVRDTILSIYFDKNSYAITLENEVKLMNVIQYLNAHPEASMDIVGYYDINSEARIINRSGHLAYNRASEAAKLLNEKYNIANNRLKKKKVSDALDYPMATLENPKNRRVDFIVRAPKL